ncbi:MAG: hypothetical protein H7123_00675 [Thermoleophilia bacterium]|nr:hypothetical protein [Thermoleophilia bacterium]
MTMIGVDTSPLQAAREWRGVSLAVAARTSGLALAQAEALEEGIADAFGSFDEMVASAVLYSATLGIGRDEAMALLDRTISSRGLEVELPSIAQVDHPTGGSTNDFSQAVRTRSAVMSSSDSLGVSLAAAAFDNMPETAVIEDPDSMHLAGTDRGSDVEAHVDAADNNSDALVASTAYANVIIDTDEAGTGELPVITEDMITAGNAGSANAQVQAALDLDPEYRAAWEQANGELETWAATRERWSPTTERVRSFVARVAGEERADVFADRSEQGLQWVRNITAGFRTWMKRSEHAPLIVAVSLGIVLIALLIAVASAVSSNNKPALAPTPAVPAANSPMGAAPAGPTPPDPVKVEPTVAKPIMLPAQVHLQIVNIGRRKGYAAVFADKLKTKGYPIDSVGNAKSGFGGPVILCNKSMAREQARLSKQTGITTLDTLPTMGGTQYCVIAVS